MAEPQAGATIEQLELADKRGADLLRKSLGVAEIEIRAAGTPGAEAWPAQFRRTRAEELPNVVTIAPVQVRDFQRIATSIRELVHEATGPSVWIPPSR
jgi:hypothetical protein